jgi:hypothetical protein
LLVLDGAPSHRCGDLVVPDNVTLLFREKIFKNYGASGQA